MKVRILSCAETEIATAMDYYNEQYPGLGYELAAEAKESLRRVSAYPDAWPFFSDTTRRCLLNRFPYAILYRHKGNEVIVFGFMHLKQNPQKWHKLVSPMDGKDREQLEKLSRNKKHVSEPVTDYKPVRKPKSTKRR